MLPVVKLLCVVLVLPRVALSGAVKSVLAVIAVGAVSASERGGCHHGAKLVCDRRRHRHGQKACLGGGLERHHISASALLEWTAMLSTFTISIAPRQWAAGLVASSC